MDSLKPRHIFPFDLLGRYRPALVEIGKTAEPFVLL